MTGDPTPLDRWLAAYALLREREGRGDATESLALPYVTTGPVAAQWRIRARTYDRFVDAVLLPLERAARRPLSVLDLGAGNGWLAARMVERGHRALAMDLRLDAADGLAAGALFARRNPRGFARVAAPFEALPARERAFDLAVFNASLHYASDLSRALSEARRAVRSGGRIALLDSPFYRSAEAGEAMVREKARQTRQSFPDLAEGLLALRTIDYLTPRTLAEAASPLGLRFRRFRVRYPIPYELRGLRAFLRRQRPPSRFDLWVAAVG